MGKHRQRPIRRDRFDIVCHSSGMRVPVAPPLFALFLKNRFIEQTGPRRGRVRRGLEILRVGEQGEVLFISQDNHPGPRIPSQWEQIERAWLFRLQGAVFNEAERKRWIEREYAFSL